MHPSLFLPLFHIAYYVYFQRPAMRPLNLFSTLLLHLVVYSLVLVHFLLVYGYRLRQKSYVPHFFESMPTDAFASWIKFLSNPSRLEISNALLRPGIPINNLYVGCKVSTS